jgi:hypothetical protein
MKKNLFALLLLVGVVFSSCSKDTPAVTDARDKFVGTWSGTVNVYDMGTLVGTTTTSYTVTKDATSSDRILFNDNGAVNSAIVNGSSYSTSYTQGDASFSTLCNGSGVLNGNSIIENGTYTVTDLSTGDVADLTYTLNLSK